jgi:cell division septation protein DedD
MRRSSLLRIGFALLSVALLGQASLTQRALAQDSVPCPTSTPTATPTVTITPTATQTATPEGVAIEIGDTVWDDFNQNGQQDDGEPGVPGITVQLWNSTRTGVVQETQTDALGNYTLTAYTPGLYWVRVVLPAVGDRFTAQDVTDADPETDDEALDSDIHPSGEGAGFTRLLDLTGDPETIRRAPQDIDAGIIRCGAAVASLPTISATATGSNGSTGDSASATAGIPTHTATATLVIPSNTPSATLTSPPDAPSNTPTATVTTPPDAPSNTPTATVTNTPGDPSNTPTASATPDDDEPGISVVIPLITLDISVNLATATRTPSPINVGNFVWDDLDQDGEQDAGEPGIPNVTVQLWNGAKNQLLGSTTTNANGNYTLVAPTPGNYFVRVILPNIGDSFSPKDQTDDTDDSDFNDDGFTDVYVFASNLISISSIDAGIVLFRTPTPTRTPTPINVGNFVWDDLDQDGVQDAGEPGLSGLVVQLWNDGKTQMIDSTVTNANGNYTLVAPTPGSYRVRVVLPGAGDAFSPKDQTDDTDDSDFNSDGFTDTYVFASNLISISSIDAGVVVFRTPTPTRTPTPINLGNFVWDDLDEDGVQDPGEPGLEGITVQLWNNALTQMIDSTVTNANGNYTLVAPLPGSYRVRVLLEGNDSFSPKDQTDDTDDSDFNDNGFTDTIVIASNVISISSIDAGVIQGPIFVAPIEVQIPPAVQPLSADVCAGFLFTSPRDGLPNGVATFYWNPAAVPMTYQVQILEGGAVLAVFNGGSGTSVSGDVSQGAIGGAFAFTVRVVGFLNGNAVCTSEANVFREAPQGGAPPPPIVPTVTPTRCPPVRVC